MLISLWLLYKPFLTPCIIPGSHNLTLYPRTYALVTVTPTTSNFSSSTIRVRHLCTLVCHKDKSLFESDIIFSKYALLYEAKYCISLFRRIWVSSTYCVSSLSLVCKKRTCYLNSRKSFTSASKCRNDSKTAFDLDCCLASFNKPLLGLVVPFNLLSGSHMLPKLKKTAFNSLEETPVLIIA